MGQHLLFFWGGFGLWAMGWRGLVAALDVGKVSLSGDHLPGETEAGILVILVSAQL